MQRIKSLKEIQKIQLDILKYIHKKCEENQLSYFLCGGSLIGAIRHKGFIPWDDDMDILLPREDYEKLARIVNADKNSPYRMMTCTNDWNYYYTFGKITDSRTVWERSGYRRTKGLGIHVDIFPYDGLPDTRKGIDEYLKKIGIYRSIVDSLDLESNPRIPVLDFIIKKVAKLAAIIANLIAKQYKIKESNMVACSVAGFGKREIIKPEAYSERLLWNFEKEKFYVPVGYHEYLTNMFRDYMTPPPLTQRKSPHGIRAWRK